MIPLPVYLATLSSNLEEGFDMFRLMCAESLGYGTTESDWTSKQVSELNRRVNEAYRYVLYPEVFPDEKAPHVWSFLEQITTLTTVADDWDYTLPSDFGSICGDFTFAEGTGYGPIRQTSEALLRNQRQFRTRTGHPEMFALRWRAQTTASTQRQEVLFYPKPDGAYTLTYKYAVLVAPISKSNPFPLGGPRVSQLMIEACRAVGEMVKNGQRGDRWNAFRDALRAAAQMDRRTNFSPTMGRMRSPGGRFLQGPLVSGVSYYFGPGGVDGNGDDVPDGTYVLET